MPLHNLTSLICDTKQPHMKNKKEERRGGGGNAQSIQKADK